MSELSQSPDASTQRKPRRPYMFWIAFASVALALYYIPLIGYMWRLGDAVGEHGFSRETMIVVARHTDWFKRYFTGPVSDEELIAFFHQHRAEMERAADLYGRYGHCYGRQVLVGQQECKQLEKRSGTRVRVGSESIPNSIYLNSKSVPSSSGFVQDHYFYDREPQNWWRSSNDKIRAWEKSFLYVPPLLPAGQLGLNPKDYPDNPLEVVRRACHIKNSLDSVPSEIEVDALPHYECAVRQIDSQWFISLRPIAKDWKN